jgi:hypothetical protein
VALIGPASALFWALGGAAAGKLPSVTIETAIDRPGGDYHSFDVGNASVEACRTACAKDSRCRAYTFVRPGVQGKLARCWLKDSVSKARKGACCDSGVKPAPSLRALLPALVAPAIPEGQRVRSVEVLLQVHVDCNYDVLAAPTRLGVSLVKVLNERTPHEGRGERTDLWLNLYRSDTLIGRYRRIDWYRGRADLTPGVYERAFYQADYRARIYAAHGYPYSRECAYGVRSFRGRRLMPVDTPLSATTYDSRFPIKSALLPYGARLILRAAVWPEGSQRLPPGASLAPPTPVQ